MIRDAEIRRIAGASGVEPRIVELDYALGWALRGIAVHGSLSRRLVFKGGTCLRKCYFPGYRFSEDLDFTAVEWSGWAELEQDVEVETGDIPRRLSDRRAEFEADWERNLVRLVPPDAVLEFHHAWEAVTGYVTRMAEDLDQRGQGAQQTPRLDGDGA